MTTNIERGSDSGSDNSERSDDTKIPIDRLNLGQQMDLIRMLNRKKAIDKKPTGSEEGKTPKTQENPETTSEK